MVKMVRVFLVVVCAGCELKPLEVSGLRCSVTRPCGEGFVCVELRCFPEGMVPDAGSEADIDAGVPDSGIARGVNLLVNPDFEQFTADASVVGWRINPGRLFSAPDGHTGARSARLQSTGPRQSLVLLPEMEVDGPELGMLFCASVWVRGETDAGVDVTLQVRDRFFDGGIANSSGTRVEVRNSWVQVKEEFASRGTSTLQFRLTTNARFDAGEGIFADDAWLSRAEVTGCP
jgi:hypothetical protein